MNDLSGKSLIVLTTARVLGRDLGWGADTDAPLRRPDSARRAKKGGLEELKPALLLALVVAERESGRDLDLV